MTATTTTPAALTLCRRIGTSGSVLLALGGWTAGSLPAYDASGLWRERGAEAADVGTVLTYLGLVLLVCAWWRLGRIAGSLGAGELVRVLVWWSAPLVIGPPLFSSDVYSYVAQGLMSVRGLDVYQLGPAALGGPLVHSIPAMWQHTPAPYGPAFVGMAQAVVRLTGSAVVPAVLGMRAVCLASLAVIVWAVRALARATGVSEGGALWAAALNPLVICHLVAGAHNDALMLALMMTGLVLARRGRLLWAVVAVSLATIVKAPAGTALLFLVPLSPRWRGRIWPGVWRVLAGASVATAVTATVSVVTGRGLGWIAALRTPVSVESVWSASTDVGRLLAWAASVSHTAGTESAWSRPDTITAVRVVCLLAALVAIVLWARRAPAVGPEYALGLSLLTLVVLSPAVQPWYALWGLLPLAATAWHRLSGAWQKTLVVVLVFSVLPDGHGPALDDLVTASLGIALALAALYGSTALRWLSGGGAGGAFAEQKGLP
ncbi:polyprenol phosphomannose-dependent alpha 1,6 mannosyltransferase MptB [Streptomyces sp. RB6PN25]|uniref:Polyprenol phosphomannose-dependent alpha 1,6 mannosyltransferase MptB n=1 Tax=Streptomyces humicola TaxID=2953240 RepID=A0ABT1PWL9_9ACTN|nr:polyprenol phosphomannose-dependent alpha 1,6 mannosyltransferase MptB [Streptomyces humicola]MCQ4082067.1 polyprenol phosphomannose-dependent alpha 1,6 mannosyltransferase MptB [Streptomyces humicola]